MKPAACRLAVGRDTIDCSAGRGVVALVDGLDRSSPLRAGRDALTAASA